MLRRNATKISSYLVSTFVIARQILNLNVLERVIDLTTIRNKEKKDRAQAALKLYIVMAIDNFFIHNFNVPMDSFQYSEPKQDIRGFHVDNKPASFFPYPICNTINLNPSAHGGFSSEESPLYATTEGTGNYVEMSSPTVATTPTATTNDRHNVLEQYISPTSNCSDRPYFSEEED